MTSSRPFVLCAVAAVALLAALPSFLARKAPGTGRLAEYGDQFAMGVFIATGLVHMLPHAAHDLADIHPGFPLAFAIAAATLLALLLLSLAWSLACSSLVLVHQAVTLTSAARAPPELPRSPGSPWSSMGLGPCGLWRPWSPWGT